MTTALDAPLETGPGPVSRWTRLAGAGGVASIAIALLAGALDRMWTFPATGAGGAEIAAYAGAHRTVLMVAMVANATAVALWLPLGAAVAVRLRERGADAFLLACFGLGVAAFAALLLAGFTSFFLLVYRAPEAAGAKLLYDLTFGLLAMSGLPTALALGAYAATGSSRATVALAALGALAHLALLASFVLPSGFFSLQGGVILAIPATLFAWIAATGAELARADTTWASPGRLS